MQCENEQVGCPDKLIDELSLWFMNFAGDIVCSSVTWSWAHKHKMWIMYLKDLDKPGETVDVATSTTRYVMGFDKDSISVHSAEEFEAGLLHSLMQPFLLREEMKQRVAEQQRSSKRNRNPRRHGWITHTPPAAHAGIVDVLKRLNCSISDRKLHAKYYTAAFIDFTSFVDEQKAIDHGKHCLGWIQSELDPLPLVWGQSSSNIQVVHELQLDNKLGFYSMYFKDGSLGPYLINHPLYRTRITPGNPSYTANLFKEVVIRAVIVWPTCFVGMSCVKWKQVLGQLELFCQHNWLQTHGEDLSGNRDQNMTSKAMIFAPTNANLLLSFIYSAEYHSSAVMAFSKNSKVAWPTALEGMKLMRDGTPRVLPPPQSRRLASLIEEYKLKMIPPYVSEGGEWAAWERELASNGASTSKDDEEESDGYVLSPEDDSSAGPMTTRKGKRKSWDHLLNSDFRCVPPRTSCCPQPPRPNVLQEHLTPQRLYTPSSLTFLLLMQ